MQKQLFVILLLACTTLLCCSAQDDQEQACPANETYRECASACEPRCGDRPGEMACIAVCKPGQCQCSQGYVRNASGQCVASADCPRDNSSQCVGKNEMYRKCSTCEPSCAEQNPICTKECRPPACQCAPGYVRNRPKGQCVRPSRCPPKLTCATVKCRGGTQCIVNEQGRIECVPVPAVAEPVPVAESSS